MDDSGNTKDDVKLPDNETGEKITKLFTDDGKDTSMCSLLSANTSN
jgi:translation initiation factor 5A